MSLLEIVKPAAQRRIQFADNFRQTIPARALGPHPDAIVHGLKTLAPHPASPHFEVIAQKVKALPPLPTVSHVGLLGVKTQPIDLYPGFYLRKRRLGFFSTSAQHHKVIRVSHHPIALLHHLTIQAMKVDVGQKRTDHRALRCAAARPPFLHVLDDVLMQIGLDQLQHPAIAHTLLYALHKPRMRNRVEVAPQIGLHHKGVALSKQSVHFAKRLFAAKTRAKAITHLQELPLKDGYTLSIRLNHLPPLTPFASAANMRSFHTEASTHLQSLLWASAPCVATSGTPGALLSLCFVVKLTLPPSYPPFPRSGFASRPSRGFHRSGTTGTLSPAPLTYGTGLPAYCSTPSCRSVSNHVVCLD